MLTPSWVHVNYPKVGTYVCRLLGHSFILSTPWRMKILKMFPMELSTNSQLSHLHPVRRPNIRHEIIQLRGSYVRLAATMFIFPYLWQDSMVATSLLWQFQGETYHTFVSISIPSSMGGAKMDPQEPSPARRLNKLQLPRIDGSFLRLSNFIDLVTAWQELGVFGSRAITFPSNEGNNLQKPDP